MTNAVNYLVRNSSLSLIKEFVEDPNALDFCEKLLFPIVFKLSKDKVSNVRYNCALILKKGFKTIRNKELLNELKAILEDFKKDLDPDVSIVANEAD